MTAARPLFDLDDDLTPPLRVVADTRPCHRCGEQAQVYEGDPRAQGWWRLECGSCGAWGDVEPARR